MVAAKTAKRPSPTVFLLTVLGYCRNTMTKTWWTARSRICLHLLPLYIKVLGDYTLLKNLIMVIVFHF